jgi:hypothetical protein
MKPTKKQSLIIISVLLVIAILYFVFKKKNTESGFAGTFNNLLLDQIKNLDISQWNSIGDDFFVPNNSYKALAKKYIDGTIQYGSIINEKGEYYRNTGEKEDLGDGKFNLKYEWTIYPKDKGFMKADGKGNYFYFEPLPDFKLQEIQRLIDIKKLADEASAKAKSEQEIKLAQEAQRQFSLKQLEAKQKTAAANKLAMEKQALLKEAEESSKNKKNIAIIVILIIASIIGFFVWKKNHKTA